MIAFRPMQPRDRQFIVESWADSMRDAYTAGIIAMERWKPVMTSEIGAIVDRAEVIVAHDPDDPDPIADLYGFIAHQPGLSVPFVYYVYVKQLHRRGGYRRDQRVGDGIARRLFAAARIDPEGRFAYACSTRMVRLLAHKIPLARWNPLAARFPLDEVKRHDAEQSIYRNREDRGESRRRFRAG